VAGQTPVAADGLAGIRRIFGAVLNIRLCLFSVELPGIELTPEIALTCGNAGFRYAKRHEST
jgi:hypothetical protein